MQNGSTPADCVAFGLRLRSVFAIPGAQPTPAADPGSAIDLHIDTGAATLPLVPGVPPIRMEVFQLSGDTLLFEPPGIARYRFSLGESRLTVQPGVGVPLSDVVALLLATALPAALWMRGDLVLHAAAALLPGCRRAVAFAGPSRVGKSLLLGRLIHHGSSIVAEDALCLRVRAGAAIASGLPACLFERPAPFTLAKDRILTPVPLAQQAACAPLGAIVVLDRAAPPVPQRLAGSAALAAILSHFHRPLVPRLLGRMPQLLPLVGRLASELPVYRWRPAFDPAGAALLQAIGEQHDGEAAS